MSSEASIHLHNRPIEAWVAALGEHYGKTVNLTSEGREGDPWNRERFVLFIPDARLWELSRLFTDIGQSLAALAPAEEEQPEFKLTHSDGSL